MKKYSILVAVLLFWTLNTMFMMSDCHQNICPQPDCLGKWMSIFFLNYYGFTFILAYKLRRSLTNRLDRLILLFAMIYIAFLFLYFTQFTSYDSMLYWKLATSKLFSLVFSCSALVLSIIYTIWITRRL